MRKNAEIVRRFNGKAQHILDNLTTYLVKQFEKTINPSRKKLIRQKRVFRVAEMLELLIEKNGKDSSSLSSGSKTPIPALNNPKVSEVLPQDAEPLNNASKDLKIPSFLLETSYPVDSRIKKLKKLPEASGMSIHVQTQLEEYYQALREKQEGDADAEAKYQAV